jgi:hypothetical protein
MIEGSGRDDSHTEAAARLLFITWTSFGIFCIRKKIFCPTRILESGEYMIKAESKEERTTSQVCGSDMAFSRERILPHGTLL